MGKSNKVTFKETKRISKPRVVNFGGKPTIGADKIVITQKQARVLLKIIQNRKDGKKNTLDLLRRQLGYASTSGIQRHTKPLRDKGILDKDYSSDIDNVAVEVKYVLNCSRYIVEFEERKKKLK